MNKFIKTTGAALCLAGVASLGLSTLAIGKPLPGKTLIMFAKWSQVSNL